MARAVCKEVVSVHLIMELEDLPHLGTLIKLEALKDRIR